MRIVGDELKRSVLGVEVAKDGKTVEALMVPWDTPSTVVDLVRGRVVQYQESFCRGAFSRAEKQPQFVDLIWNHSELVGNVLGRGTSFHSTDAGEVGIFRLYEANAELAREALVDRGVSICFRSLSPKLGEQEREGAHVQRQAVHLDHLASVTNPAYPDAKVLAIREAQELEDAEQQESERAEGWLRDALVFRQSVGLALTEEMEQWLADHPS